MGKLRAPQIDTGTGPNQIISLDGSGKIPEVTSGLLMASKITDELIDSDAALQDDDELFVTIPVPGFYIINLYIISDGPTAADLQFRFNYADTITSSFLSVADGSLGGSGIDSSVYVVQTNPGSPAGLLWVGSGQFLNTGLFKLQWAQSVATTGAVTIRSGSYLSLQKV